MSNVYTDYVMAEADTIKALIVQANKCLTKGDPLGSAYYLKKAKELLHDPKRTEQSLCTKGGAN